MTEKERENIAELFKLIKENPELPIVPMVDNQIFDNDYFAYWLGSWGPATLDEYFISGKGKGVFIKSDEDTFDVLEKYLSPEEFETMPESEDERIAYYNNLPWIKAIIVYIDLPEREG